MLSQSIVQKAYFVGDKDFDFRVGEAAEILGVFICHWTGRKPTELGGTPQPYFKIRYGDGYETFAPLNPNNVVPLSELVFLTKYKKGKYENPA